MRSIRHSEHWATFSGGQLRSSWRTNTHGGAGRRPLRTLHPAARQRRGPRRAGCGAPGEDPGQASPCDGHRFRRGTPDWAGGGRASARETIGRVAAAAIARKLLARVAGIEVLGWVDQVAAIDASVDGSTVDAATSTEIAALVRGTGAMFLEAPVSGSKAPAEQGALIFLAAGDRQLYDRVAPHRSQSALQPCSVAGRFARRKRIARRSYFAGLAVGWRTVRVCSVVSVG